jgi:hypothetical protein
MTFPSPKEYCVDHCLFDMYIESFKFNGARNNTNLQSIIFESLDKDVVKF